MKSIAPCNMNTHKYFIAKSHFNTFILWRIKNNFVPNSCNLEWIWDSVGKALLKTFFRLKRETYLKWFIFFYNIRCIYEIVRRLMSRKSSSEKSSRFLRKRSQFCWKNFSSFLENLWLPDDLDSHKFAILQFELPLRYNLLANLLMNIFNDYSLQFFCRIINVKQKVLFKDDGRDCQRRTPTQHISINLTF